MWDYFSHNEIITLMNTTSHTASLENLNFVATLSTLLAGIYFVAVNFLF